MTAVKNTDGNLCAVFLNSIDADSAANVRVNGELVRISLPAHTISSLTLYQQQRSEDIM